MNQTAIFDVNDLLVNEVIGDSILFVFVGLIVIWIVSLKSKAPYQIPILLSVLWIGICYTITNSIAILWFLAVMLVGFIFYYGISKIINT